VTYLTFMPHFFPKNKSVLTHSLTHCLAKASCTPRGTDLEMCSKITHVTEPVLWRKIAIALKMPPAGSGYIN
jgi:hypothetical protein